jgi:hypothetical protein
MPRSPSCDWNATRSARTSPSAFQLRSQGRINEVAGQHAAEGDHDARRAPLKRRSAPNSTAWTVPRLSLLARTPRHRRRTQVAALSAPDIAKVDGDGVPPWKSSAWTRRDWVVLSL